MKQKAVKYGPALLALALTFSLMGNLCIQADAKAMEESGEAGAAVALKIDADVTRPGTNSDSFAVGQNHTWILRCGIPEGLENAREWSITDTLDHRLTYRPGSSVVTLYDMAGQRLPLEAGVHYALEEGWIRQNGQTVDQIRIELTLEGLEWAQEHLGKGALEPELQIRFQAAINTAAAAGETIPNRCRMDYTDAHGNSHQALSDQPEVHTGGITLRKSNGAGSPLPGAVFRIARLASEEELTDPAVSKDCVVLEEEKLLVVYEDFYPDMDMAGEKVGQVATDDAGMAELCGLAYGTYYIVETQAPAGYNLLTQPIAVIIDGTSHLTEADGWVDAQGKAVDNTVRVVNTKFLLPNSGGVGTTMFTVTGLWILICCAALLLMNRKRI